MTEFSPDKNLDKPTDKHAKRHARQARNLARNVIRWAEPGVTDQHSGHWNPYNEYPAKTTRRFIPWMLFERDSAPEVYQIAADILAEHDLKIAVHTVPTMDPADILTISSLPKKQVPETIAPAAPQPPEAQYPPLRLVK